MADNTNRVGGVLNMTIDGTQYALRGGWVVRPSSVKRDEVTGQDGPHGYTEMPLTPGAKGDLTTTSGLSVTQLEAITNATMQLSLANGKTYVLSNAFCKSAFEIDTSEGKVAVDFGAVGGCVEI